MGYTSGRLLAGMLVKNGVIGGPGGVLDLILVVVATMVLAKTVFKTSLAIPAPTTPGLIIPVVAIVVAIAALVSWTAVRFRQAAVLRYE